MFLGAVLLIGTRTVLCLPVCKNLFRGGSFHGNVSVPGAEGHTIYWEHKIFFGFYFLMLYIQRHSAGEAHEEYTVFCVYAYKYVQVQYVRFHCECV